jgi:hypothetical protein
LAGRHPLASVVSVGGDPAVEVVHPVLVAAVEVDFLAAVEGNQIAKDHHAQQGKKIRQTPRSRHHQKMSPSRADSPEPNAP